MLASTASAVAIASCAAIRKLRKVRFERRIISLTGNKRSWGWPVARPLIAHLARACQPSWSHGLARDRSLRTRSQHHAAGDADAQHVHPSLVEIEQMRIERGGK